MALCPPTGTNDPPRITMSLMEYILINSPNKSTIIISDSNKLLFEYLLKALFDLENVFFVNAIIYSEVVYKLVTKKKKKYNVGGVVSVEDTAATEDIDMDLIEKENIIHVLNAPSPAATASLAIGDYIAEKVISKLNNN